MSTSASANVEWAGSTWHGLGDDVPVLPAAPWCDRGWAPASTGFPSTSRRTPRRRCRRSAQAPTGTCRAGHRGRSVPAGSAGPAGRRRPPDGCSSWASAQAHSCGPRPADSSRWVLTGDSAHAGGLGGSRCGVGTEVGRLVGDQRDRGGHRRGQAVVDEVGDHLLDALVRGGRLLEEQLPVAAHHQRPHRRTAQLLDRVLGAAPAQGVGTGHLAARAVRHGVVGLRPGVRGHKVGAGCRGYRRSSTSRPSPGAAPLRCRYTPSRTSTRLWHWSTIGSVGSAPSAMATRAASSRRLSDPQRTASSCTAR